MNAEFWRGAVIMVASLMAGYVILALLGKLPKGNGRLKDLESTVRVLQSDHTRDLQRIQALEDDLRTAQGDLRDAKAHIARLETELAQYRESLPASGVAEEAPLLLAVIGSDSRLRVDLAALREVENECGLQVTRCYPAHMKRFEAILNRHRAAGQPIQYVHFSVHTRANEPAALFESGPADGVQLSGVMNGVEVAMVAGCESDMLGDLLGVVPTVVTFREPLEHGHGHLAAKLFWLAIGRGLPPRQAYRDARSKLPADVAEFMEMHL
jgi:hypothetical protein